jgi:multicomponent Na+:H+ antiporter subunit B
VAGDRRQETEGRMINIVHIVLFTFLAAVAIAVIRLRDLFAAVMLAGIFSLLSAALFTVMDAVDVAFTEASVGAGISTVLMLGTLALTKSSEKPQFNRPSLLAILVVCFTGAALIYGTFDMPRYGDPGAPIHHHMADRFITKTPEEIGVPNQVTAILASYRGYDTWGETTVIFTAAIGVMLLLSGSPSIRKKLGSGVKSPEHEESS